MKKKSIIKNFKKIKIKKITKLNVSKGDIIKFLNYKSDTYDKFGEIYFSKIRKKSIKAWKMHKKNICNILVISGCVQFVFINNNKFFNVVLNENAPKLLLIPPKHVFGFQGIGKKNIICNLINNSHSDKEVQTFPIKHFKYKWQ
jgi:dTDP-4-dehydrorhamnose 3,5-epimerase-like enzyme